jgi:hypothetical protein
MSKLDIVETKKISDLLLEASEGNRDAAAEFYKTFPESDWLVPIRNPDTESDVQYPSPLFGFLAVATTDCTIIPIFSDERYANEWAGQPIGLRKTLGQQLLTIIPEDWWIGVNPGQEVEKELSPWEIQRLGKDSPEAIAEILEDMFEAPLFREVTTKTPGPEEHTELRQALTNYGTENPAIESLYMLERHGLDLEDEVVLEILVGAACDPLLLETHALSCEKVQQELSQRAAFTQIGNTKVKVFTGIWGTHSVTLQLFANSDPFYVKQI